MSAGAGREITPGLPGKAIAIACVAALVALLAVVISRDGGPASRCDGAGGHMLVGPGGETACIDRRTFLPMEGFDPSAPVRR